MEQFRVCLHEAGPRPALPGYPLVNWQIPPYHAHASTDAVPYKSPVQVPKGEH